MANYVSTYSGAQIDAAVGKANKAVITDAQSLTDEQKSQARANIGAGTSSFSGSFDDLSNKPEYITAAEVLAILNA